MNSQVVLTAVNTTLTQLQQLYNLTRDNIPGSSVVFHYIEKSYQNDPIRIALELFLIIFAFKYFLSKPYRPDSNEVQLTEKEIEELVDEWQPESLVPPLNDFQQQELENLPIIKGPSGPYLTLENNEKYLNLTSFDFLGLSTLPEVYESAMKAVRVYGVGACGPPGFYGTLDAHLELEKKLAQFLGTEEAIIYSQAFSTISSVIPAFSKRGDILIVDEAVSFAIQKGCQISRSHVKYFKHNDMHDLEKILKQTKEEDQSFNKPLVRRFIVVEGLYQNTGNICPLPELVELKHKYKYRLILDESLSFGTLGKRGAGVSDHFDIPITEIDILSSSMAHTLASAGGFCAGSHQMIDHQRLSGMAYCFSAALPAMLAVAATKGIEAIETSGPSLLKKLRANIKVFRQAFGTPRLGLLAGETLNSPVLHLYLNKEAKDAEQLLESIVQKGKDHHLLLTRAKYVPGQERKPKQPSIRITIRADHDQNALTEAAKNIKKLLL